MDAEQGQAGAHLAGVGVGVALQATCQHRRCLAGSFSLMQVLGRRAVEGAEGRELSSHNATWTVSPPAGSFNHRPLET
jgi:hypothetical protein